MIDFNIGSGPMCGAIDAATIATPWSMSSTVGERYVAQNDAARAVIDRESQLLTELGVPQSNSHITCPITRWHPDDRHPSFRWDFGKRRAFCTCIENNHSKGYKSLDILGLAAEIKGITYSDAKVWACETLGRNDLIKTKGGKAKGGGSDPASLLQPPAALRDDSIVSVYLAHRLNIDPAHAPVPTTPCVGWRALGYYEPPSPGEKHPVKVGEFACAVFGMTDCAGRLHAHRIYVAPGGHGKADLPPLPNGDERPVKKLASNATVNGSTAGMGVTWGTLNTATWIILAEGVETAAAIAHAFRNDIGLAVVSAITAVGIEAFKPPPSCQQIIVAADRDEGGGKQRRGETAARVLCTRLAPDMKQIGYALPGQPGTNSDWLDILRDEGVDAVRQSILACQPFEPTTADVKIAERMAQLLEPKFDLEGNYRPIHTNGVILLEKYLGDGLGFDAFTQKMTYRGDPPFPWVKEPVHPVLEREINDAFTKSCMLHLQNSNCFIRSIPMTDHVLDTLARRRTYHSFQRYLDSCVLTPGSWPCTIDTFFEVVLGIAPFGPLQELLDDKTGKWRRPLSDAEIKAAHLHQRWVRAESGNFWRRIVARGRWPGVKADEAPNCLGPEGIGKSTVFRRVGEPWFTDRLPKIGDKDSLIQLAGIVLLEIGDGTHIARTHADDLKNFLSAQEDRYRGVHQRHAEDHPRVTTFVITSNNYANLTSVTGNRRLPTMESRWARPELVTPELRAQLFAETQQALDGGDKWWHTDPELVEYAGGEAHMHVEENAYVGHVARWLEENGDKYFTLDQVFDGMHITDLEARDKASKKVCKALNILGYRTGTKWVNGIPARRWFKH